MALMMASRMTARTLVPRRVPGTLSLPRHACPLLKQANAGTVRMLHVDVETTPNENSLKFLPLDTQVLDSEQGTGIQYSDESGAAGSPLARRIFKVPGVTSVFLGSNFVSVNKAEDRVWDELKPSLLSVISDAFDAGLKPVEILPDVRDAVRFAPEDAEVVDLITEIMDTRIRPTVQEDGGDVEFVAFENGIVKVQLAGSCVGCASSAETLYNGIESMLIYYVPEVKRIEQVFSGLQKVGKDEFDALEAKLGVKQQPAEEPR